ncbi:arylsulfatase [Amycolatopsis sp. GM8]|uniref:arylsulfatase n=1 Tax=Amycolatopsis sp. GM8 TaxID=2896530 RepID=UPI001F1B4EC0|nr:arylsulfatase [Amycolatopsis sp. GM8]
MTIEATDHQRGYQGKIGRYVADSQPWWPTPQLPPDGSPDIVYLVLDDVGFSDLGCYGSEIPTPNIDALARGGLRYTNFHVTPLCSPTRACLLSGRNHHSVGMGSLTAYDTGFPGYRGGISRAATLAPELLRDYGYNTFCVGKWHLTPADEATVIGPYDQWPLGRGFDRFYGFQDAETDQFSPTLVADNHSVEPPRDENYHLTNDLIDRSIGMIRNQVSLAPEKPYFLYLALGAAHAPHQAPDEYLQRFRGAYDQGWDEIRRARFERQRELGILPEGTQLVDRNDGVEAWADLSADEKRLMARFQEAYAGMLSYTDDQIGRLVAELKRLGRFENTLFLFISDNGASQEGGPGGVVDNTHFVNGITPTLEESLARIDEIGTRRARSLYPWGWAQASNTPLKRYKQNAHAGGVRVPFIVSWPGKIAESGGVRTQFHHAIDVMPTTLEALGLKAPETYRGVEQMPVHGTSMLYTFGDAAAPTSHRTQYFEMIGHRGIWQDGWKAVAHHPQGTDFDEDQWELYHVDEDLSEAVDLAQEHPDKLKEMVELWWSEAEKYGVLPLDDRWTKLLGVQQNRKPGASAGKTSFRFHNGISHVHHRGAPRLVRRSYDIDVTIDEFSSAHHEGVLVAHGNIASGYVIYVRDGKLILDYNYFSEHTVVSSAPIPESATTLSVQFRKNAEDNGGIITLLADGVSLGQGALERTMPVMISWTGLEIGGDRLAPVSDAYTAPFEFTGVIHTVDFDLL